MRKYLVVLLVLVLFVNSAMAFDFSLSSDKVPVSAGDTGSVDILVNSAIDDFLIISIDGITTWTTTPTNIPVLARQPAKATIYLSPYNWSSPTLYKMVVKLESMNTKEVIERNLSVIVKTSNVAIEDMLVDGLLKPEGQGNLQIFVKNYENKDVNTELVYTVTDPSGDVFLTNREAMAFGSKEFRIVQKQMNFPECFKAGVYKVLTELREGNNKLFSVEDTFKIDGEFKVAVEKREKQEFLRTNVAITIKNTGNIAGTTSVSEKIWGSLFFSGDLPTTIGNEYIWSVSLASCETKVIKYSIDYTIIPVILIIALVLFYVFFRLRTVWLRKYIIQKQVIEKGVEFTVGIEFKAHASVKDVEIKDFVPAVFKVVDAGKATKHESHAGTELVWKFNELKRGEERIVSYKIVPLLSVTGSVKLPRTSIAFNYLGKRIERKTMPVYIGIDPEDYERGFSFSHLAKHVAKKVKEKTRFRKK